jgi:hypothetical protein
MSKGKPYMDNSKLHWTQRPENKAKVRRVLISAQRARHSNKTNSNKANSNKAKHDNDSVVSDLRVIVRRAKERLMLIDDAIHKLELEKKEILDHFPTINEETRMLQYDPIVKDAKESK